MLINGKQRNLQRRKFCLSCSPFDLHNTRNLVKINAIASGICPCGAKFNPNQRKGKFCWTCYNKTARNKKADKLYELMGGCCWLCGYNRCRMAMDFHHYDESTKVMQLTIREMNLSWDRIWAEAQKCILLCCICHREYHSGLIEHSVVEKAYLGRWSQIHKKGM